jgi:hypothetical protein
MVKPRRHNVTLYYMACLTNTANLHSATIPPYEGPGFVELVQFTDKAVNKECASCRLPFRNPDAQICEKRE